MREIPFRSSLKIKLTIAEYRRDKKIGIYIWPAFWHVAETQQVVHEGGIAYFNFG